MINGAHGIIYSQDPDADRAFCRDILGLPSVDAGDGWLIFGLPPSELAFHPMDGEVRHEIYFLAEDIHAFVGEMQARGFDTGPVEDRDWGLISSLTLPGGGKLRVYEPRHPRPPAME